MSPYLVLYGKSLIAGTGIGGLPLFWRQGRCSTTGTPEHTVPGTSRSMWEQGLACIWLFPSTRRWSQFPACLYVFTPLGCLRIFGLTGKYRPRDMSESLEWSNMRSQVGLAHQLEKNKNSSLRKEYGGKDSARCFQGAESEASQDSTDLLAELPRSRKQDAWKCWKFNQAPISFWKTTTSETSQQEACQRPKLT